MGRANDDFYLTDGTQLRTRFLVHPDHLGVSFAHDQKRRRPHFGQRFARQIGAAAAPIPAPKYPMARMMERADKVDAFDVAALDVVVVPADQFVLLRLWFLSDAVVNDH
jgi:hypothetical protein